MALEKISWFRGRFGEGKSFSVTTILTQQYHVSNEMCNGCRFMSVCLVNIVSRTTVRQHKNS